jgi:site-specific DNA-methyltransferase (adenine-specific)
MKHEPENLILAHDEPPASGTAKGVGSGPWLGGLEATCEDCMALMARYPDKHFDLAIVDPPYGLGDALVAGGTWPVKYQAKGAKWDVKPEAEYFQELQRVAKNWIIWGANYYSQHLPPTRGFVVWHKPNMEGMHTMANCELAWTSFDRNAKTVSITRPNEDRIHVCQKPVKLYTWLLENYAKPGMKLLDTHLGSGSHAIAAHYFGAHLTACEIDPDYYAAAMARIKRETAQMTLFA